MAKVGALEFQRKFGEVQHQAQREPVEITRHGRRESAADWRRVADCIATRDADGAERAGRRLLEHSAARVRQHYDETAREPV